MADRTRSVSRTLGKSRAWRLSPVVGPSQRPERRFAQGISALESRSQSLLTGEAYGLETPNFRLLSSA